MFTISVKSNIAQFAKEFASVADKQVRFATAVALTKTAQKAKTEVVEEMKQVFDRPTPYTLNSLRVKSATKADLTALVWFKDDTFKGTPATKYLGPQVFGGGRGFKRMERALQARGLLPSGMYAVPGSAAKLDAYGNMSRGQIVQILSALGAAETKSGYAANRTARSARRGRKPQFFVAPPGGHLPPGVWQRFGFAFGSAIRPVLMFTSQPHYGKRLRFAEVVQRTVDRHFEREFKTALASAIASAR